MNLVHLPVHSQHSRLSQNEIQHIALFFFPLPINFLFSFSPIFEEDTPSVMEIEMEELDKWMNSMNRNGRW